MRTRVLVIAYADQKELDMPAIIQYSGKFGDVWKSERPFIKRLFRKIAMVPVCTGIGKVSAFESTCKVLDSVLEKYGPKCDITVLNVGTAASVSLEIGSVVECDRFLDRDLYSIYKAGYINLEDVVMYRDNNNVRKLDIVTAIPGHDWKPERYSCNTGDTFVTDPCEAVQLRDGWTVVCDMEGFSIARAVEMYKTKFKGKVKLRCVKYVTDKIGGDSNSISGWESRLSDARECLTEDIVKELVRNFYMFS